MVNPLFFLKEVDNLIYKGCKNNFNQGLGANQQAANDNHQRLRLGPAELGRSGEDPEAKRKTL